MVRAGGGYSSVHQFKTSAAPVAALVASYLALAACTGVPLSAPPLPAPPPPPVKPAIVWTPRVVPQAPARAAASFPARPARLDAMAPPPPAPVLRGLQLEPVPEVRVPARFCSVDEKYAFIDARQLPAYDAAMRNSVAASAYKRELSELYARYRDASAGGVHSGEVMAELKRVGPIADAAFAKASATQALFDTVMAVPVKGRCKG